MRIERQTKAPVWFKAGVVGVILFASAVLAFWGGVICVALHFIAKFW